MLNIKNFKCDFPYLSTTTIYGETKYASIKNSLAVPTKIIVIFIRYVFQRIRTESIRCDTLISILKFPSWTLFVIYYLKYSLVYIYV